LFAKIIKLLDIFHTTPQSSQPLIPIAFDNQCVARVAALRETKMSSSVQNYPLLPPGCNRKTDNFIALYG
jgi:hypothetical protein